MLLSKLQERLENFKRPMPNVEIANKNFQRISREFLITELAHTK